MGQGVQEKERTVMLNLKQVVLVVAVVVGVGVDVAEPNFNKYLANTLTFEGGLHATEVNQPQKFYENTYKLWAKQKDIEVPEPFEPNHGEVSDFFKDEFYERPKIDQLPEELQGVVFDWGVQSGAETAIERLQKIVKTKADGLIGKNTIKQINKYIEKNGIEDLLDTYSNDRRDFIEDLILNDVSGEYDGMHDGLYNRVERARQAYTVSP